MYLDPVDLTGCGLEGLPPGGPLLEGGGPGRGGFGFSDGAYMWNQAQSITSIYYRVCNVYYSGQQFTGGLVGGAGFDPGGEGLGRDGGG